ncbi:hypothetical protein HMPREF3201_01376 [Megasphaera sp. MJR8396C]|nr:hypothetical protein HMPREF3201_01376 [Megasphaera sp. MJR8396C]
MLYSIPRHSLNVFQSPFLFPIVLSVHLTADRDDFSSQRF